MAQNETKKQAIQNETAEDISQQLDTAPVIKLKTQTAEDQQALNK